MDTYPTAILSGELLMAADSRQPNADYEFASTSPSALSAADFARCVAIVSEGGAVTADNAQRGLARAAAIVVVRKQGEIIALGAIKRAASSYVARVSRKAQHPLAAGVHELGYVAVDQPHRGQHLSSQIVRVLRQKEEGRLFATTDDVRMKKVLKDAGFQHKGREWKGDRGLLSLWITEEGEEGTRR